MITHNTQRIMTTWCLAALTSTLACALENIPDFSSVGFKNGNQTPLTIVGATTVENLQAKTLVGGAWVNSDGLWGQDANGAVVGGVTLQSAAEHNDAYVSSKIANGKSINFPAGKFPMKGIIYISGRSNIILKGATGVIPTTLSFISSLSGIYGKDDAANGGHGIWHGGTGAFINVGIRPPQISSGPTGSSNNIGIENLHITFPGRTKRLDPEAGFHAIGFSGKDTYDCYVKNVSVDRFENGICIYQSRNITIDGAHLIKASGGAHFGIMLQNAKQCLVNNSWIEGTAACHDIALQGASNNVVANSRSWQISFRGQSGLGNNLFSNCNITLAAKDEPYYHNNPYNNNAGYGSNEWYWNIKRNGILITPATVVQDSAIKLRTEYGLVNSGGVVTTKIFDASTTIDLYQAQLNRRRGGGPSNTAPNVTITGVPNVTLPATVATLNASIQDDGLPSNGTLTRSWTKTSGPAATIAVPTAPNTTVTLSAAGTYVFSLTVSDGALSTTRSVTVNLLPAPTANVAPIVSAGTSQTVTLNVANTVTVGLRGSVTDADGDVTTKQWSKVSGPAAAVVFSAGTAELTTATFTTAGTYVLRLTADDGHGHRAFGEVQVAVNAYVAPQTFVRRINLGGEASTIGGNTWMAYNAALTQGLSVIPVPRIATSTLTTISPVADATTKSMLNSAIWNTVSFAINQTLPNGNYSVSLWVMENYETNHRSFHVSMEGVSKALNIGSMAFGAWRKYTYATTVSDGQLNIALTKVTGEPGVMGLEIVSVSAVAARAFDDHFFATWMLAPR